MYLLCRNTLRSIEESGIVFIHSLRIQRMGKVKIPARFKLFKKAPWYLQNSFVCTRQQRSAVANKFFCQKIANSHLLGIIPLAGQCRTIRDQRYRMPEFLFRIDAVDYIKNADAELTFFSCIPALNSFIVSLTTCLFARSTSMGHLIAMEQNRTLICLKAIQCTTNQATVHPNEIAAPW